LTSETLAVREVVGILCTIKGTRAKDKIRKAS